MLSQMQELVARVQAALPEPWDKKVGRPKLCGLYRAVETVCMYIRQNVTQENIIQNSSMPHASEKKNNPRAASYASW
jgi:hypothetical protein